MFVTGHLHGVSRTSRGGRALALVFVLLALFMAAALGLFTAPAQAAETVEYSAEEIAFITLLNEYRVANGRQPLLVSDVISLAAQRHSSDMGKYAYFNHYTQGSDWFWSGAAPWDRMRASGYNYNTAMGENIAAGQTSALLAFNCFKGSDGHRAVMLSTDYKVVGIGFEYIPGSPYGWYWTLDFGGYVDPSAHETGYYQQSDSRINYLGKWGSAGTFYWADDKGSAALISFRGTTIELYAQVANWGGKAEVSVDGRPPLVVDFYSSTTASKQLVYVKENLADDFHTLTIKCLREKNPSSQGYAITLDAIRVMKNSSTPGSLEQAPLADRYQQDDGRIAYMGDWTDKYTYWLASNCTYKYVGSPGASVNVTFDGTYLSWVGTKGSDHGMAQISLDGGELQTVDLHSPYTQYKQKIYDTGILDDGVHTLSIYWIGAKNPASSNYYISTDTFDVFGELLAADPADPICWTYEQSDPRITYVGSWATRWDGRASAWSFFYSLNEGAGALINFDGKKIEIVAKKGPSYGPMELTLLDKNSAVVDTQVVDLYESQDVFGQTVYSIEGLTNGPYTLVVQATGDMNPLGYNLINIDGVCIDGYLTQGPALDRYQQDSSAFSYTGSSWATGWGWSPSGFSFCSIDEAGAKVTIDFQGSYLSLVSRTTPWYGKAKVTLDGDYANSVIVDLYSASVGWKVPVYNTGLITPGAHTLEVEWTGEKSWSSWGTAIAVDAVDVLGSSD